MYKPHPQFDVYQCDLPSEIKPALRRIYGQGEVDRVPEFLRIVKRDWHTEVFSLGIDGQQHTIESVHVAWSFDEDGVYADMRGYAINSIIYFVFSKGVGNENKNHKIAQVYLRKLLQNTTE